MVVVGSDDGPVRTVSDAEDLERSETAIATGGRCKRGTSDISLVALIAAFGGGVGGALWAPITAFGGGVGGALVLGWAGLGWRGGHKVAKWYFGYNLLT